MLSQLNDRERDLVEMEQWLKANPVSLFTSVMRLCS